MSLVAPHLSVLLLKMRGTVRSIIVVLEQAETILLQAD
jgi:hypothetical protein